MNEFEKTVRRSYEKVLDTEMLYQFEVESNVPGVKMMYEDRKTETVSEIMAAHQSNLEAYGVEQQIDELERVLDNIHQGTLEPALQERMAALRTKNKEGNQMIRIKATGENAADRIMMALDNRINNEINNEPKPTRKQVGMVLHALADFTAITEMVQFDRLEHNGSNAGKETEYCPTETSIGRWLHRVGDDLETPQ